jgi:hypothetical protein
MKGFRERSLRFLSNATMRRNACASSTSRSAAVAAETGLRVPPFERLGVTISSAHSARGEAGASEPLVANNSFAGGGVEVQEQDSKTKVWNQSVEPKCRNQVKKCGTED